MRVQRDLIVDQLQEQLQAKVSEKFVIYFDYEVFGFRKSN